MNILIVDDKFDVVQGIAQGVDWNSIGEITLFFAYSGEEALEIISKNHIQFLITDIEMPGMSGLELAEKLKKQRQNIGIVFLTSYDSFRYAQSAIRLGCYDYILQPVDYQKLQNSLIAAINKMLTEKIEKDLSHSAEVQQYNALRIENAWREIIFRVPAYTEREMRDVLEEVQIYPPSGMGYRMVLVTLFWKCEAPNNWFAHHKENELHKEIEETLRKNVPVIIGLKIPTGQRVFIVGGGNVVIQMKAFLQRTNLDKSISLSVCVSEETELQNLPQAYQDLVRLNSLNVGRYSGVFEYGAVEDSIRNGDLVRKQLSLQSWKSWLLENGEDLIREDVARFLKKQDSSKQLNKRTLAILAQLIISTLYSFSDKNAEETVDNLIQSDVYVHCTESAAKLLRFLDEAIEKWQLDAQKNRSDGVTGLLTQIKRYVNSHLEESLSREEVAERFYISKDYLSHIFVKEEGVGFTQYVNKRRTEKAKELLRSTALPIKIISLNVGIADYAYFSKMFRKMEGTSAVEYRAQFRKE